MKILKVLANNFLKCEDNFSVSYVPTGNKSLEDKEYELSEIDENLFVFNTIGIVGKNASGKTTTIKLLNLVYDIFSNLKVKDNLKIIKDNNKAIELKTFFYNDHYIYYYKTTLKYVLENDYVAFKNEELYSFKYTKTKNNEIFNLDKFNKVDIKKDLPEDTSLLYYIFKKINIRANTYDSKAEKAYSLIDILSLYNTYKKNDLLNAILELLDEHIKKIEIKNLNKYTVYFNNNTVEQKNKEELYDMLSSGTIKGLTLYMIVYLSLVNGTDLVIDEIENHFNKTLVDNIINLFKDKSLNKKCSTLIFTTHYSELLDLFNRTDNIYITKYESKIKLESVLNYHLRSDAVKSKKFYENAFGTSVNYENLMNLKKVLLNEISNSL